MPLFVWAAFAVAILIIGGSIASSVPEITDRAVPAIAQSTSNLLSPVGWGLAIAIVVFAIIIGLNKIIWR